MKPTKPELTDRTKFMAAKLWTDYPHMKPLGKERQARHLADLEALLAVLSQTELIFMIETLRADPYRRDWVASFSRIAEELPRIRTALAKSGPTRRDTFMSEWNEKQP